jgi:CBS domain-containing protein
MQVQEIMTKDVSYCSPATNAATAAEIMWNQNCGSLPVVDDGGRVVGIVTDRDLFIALGTKNQRPAELPVGEMMTHDVYLCAAEDDLQTALRRMAQKQVHRLPVVDRRGALKGVLSIDDVVVNAKSETLSREILSTMRAICDHQIHQRGAA